MFLSRDLTAFEIAELEVERKRQRTPSEMVEALRFAASSHNFRLYPAVAQQIADYIEYNEREKERV